MKRDIKTSGHAGKGGQDDMRLRELLDRPEVAAAYVFGSTADGSAHALSDVDIAYLGSDALDEERAFDSLYEGLQRLYGEGGFSLVPMRRAPIHIRFEIVTRGRPVIMRDIAGAEAFAAGAISRHLDFKHVRDEYFATRGTP